MCVVFPFPFPPGIVQGQATVDKVIQKEDFRTIALRFPEGSLEAANIGASVAINCTCLTIVSIEAESNLLTFDVIGETLDKTNLGELEEGHKANFERAARIGDEIGGHNVSGHVHTIGRVRQVETSENNVRYNIEVPQEWIKYVLPKGYIAVDGISLTVGEVEENTFNLYLIPETLRVTTLGKKAEGTSVNIEIDSQTQTIVDTIEKYMKANNLVAQA